jgi:hypothetical protein
MPGTRKETAVFFKVIQVFLAVSGARNYIHGRFGVIEG